jgi:hypothetical protein
MVIKYPDGTHALAGDDIQFGAATNVGLVVAVVADDLADYNVREPGIMVRSSALGLVFIPAARFADNAVIFTQRGKSRPLWVKP